jgi:hypothetical protein
MKAFNILPLVIATVVCFCIQLSAKAQTTPAPYQMESEIEQAIAKMRETKADAEVVQALSAIPDHAEKATQVFLASLNVLDLEQRSGVLTMLFQLPITDDGVSVAHLPLLINLYAKSALFPLPHQPRPRAFIDDSVLQSRLLDILASLLHAEVARNSLAAGEPVPRLLELLEASHGSPVLSDVDQKLVKDIIGNLRDEKYTGQSKKNVQVPPSPTMTPPTVQPPAPKQAPEAMPVSTQSEEPTSSTPWSIIVVLVVVVNGLLWLLLKKRK